MNGEFQCAHLAVFSDLPRLCQSCRPVSITSSTSCASRRLGRTHPELAAFPPHGSRDPRRRASIILRPLSPCPLQQSGGDTKSAKRPGSGEANRPAVHFSGNPPSPKRSGILPSTKDARHPGGPTVVLSPGETKRERVQYKCSLSPSRRQQNDTPPSMLRRPHHGNQPRNLCPGRELGRRAGCQRLHRTPGLLQGLQAEVSMVGRLLPASVMGTAVYDTDLLRAAIFPLNSAANLLRRSS